MQIRALGAASWTATYIVEGSVAPTPRQAPHDDKTQIWWGHIYVDLAAHSQCNSLWTKYNKNIKREMRLGECIIGWAKSVGVSRIRRRRPQPQRWEMKNHQRQEEFNFAPTTTFYCGIFAVKRASETLNLMPASWPANWIRCWLCIQRALGFWLHNYQAPPASCALTNDSCGLCLHGVVKI